MHKTKIAITIEEQTLQRVDRLVHEGKYKSRSSAIQEAIENKLSDGKRMRLICELSKLDRFEEQKLADESLEDEEWAEY